MNGACKPEHPFCCTWSVESLNHERCSIYSLKYFQPHHHHHRDADQERLMFSGQIRIASLISSPRLAPLVFEEVLLGKFAGPAGLLLRGSCTAGLLLKLNELWPPSNGGIAKGLVVHFPRGALKRRSAQHCESRLPLDSTPSLCTGSLRQCVMVFAGMFLKLALDLTWTEIFMPKEQPAPGP